MTLAEEIATLKSEKNAVILAHNYCRGEVQDIADFTGDSLELARRATEIDAAIIVLCGVYFMAETAKILNPSRKVLVPDLQAGCPMAEMVSAEQVKALKIAHPGAKAVCYVNSTAAVKAECDLCVTSGNAERVMATLKGERVIFVPDCHLGGYLERKLGAKYLCWPGFCPVHAKLTLSDIAEGRRQAGAGAPVLVHPECGKAVREAADFCLSTGGICRFVKESTCETFVVGTETGILHRLRKENPSKNFVSAGELVCPDMKRVTLEGVRDALIRGEHEVVVPEEIATRAKRAIDAMLALSI